MTQGVYLHLSAERRLDLGTIDTSGGRGVVGRTIKRSLNGAVLRATLDATLLLNVVVILVVHNGHANVSRVDVAVAPDEESTEAGLSDEVEDTVEDGLGVGGDDVTTLAETPGDGVQNPEEGSQRAAVQEGLLDFGAVADGVAARFPDELVDDVEKSNAA